MTYNNFITLLDGFTTNHLILKRFNRGIFSDIETFISDSTEFPVLWVRLNNISYNNPIKQWDFNILIFDLLKTDKVNELDVISDSVQIAEDLIKFLSTQTQIEYQIINTTRIEPFTERFSDFVAGVNITITLETDEQLLNDCEIPENN
jgi:hypothetical protein